MDPDQESDDRKDTLKQVEGIDDLRLLESLDHESVVDRRVGKDTLMEERTETCWTTTQNISATKTPPITNSAIVLSMTSARDEKSAPRAKDPESPMKIFAG